MIHLETERLTIRELGAADRRPLAAMLADSRVMAYSVRGPMDESAVADFIDTCQRSYREDGFGPWALVERASRRLVGFCGLSRVELDGRAEIEIGYRLAYDLWGRGLATEAGTAILAYGFAHWRPPSVVAIIARAHVASRRVATKLGMRFDRDTHHAGWDVAIFRRARLPAVPN